jgi:polyhydroxybutyrate depolymerase
VIGSVAEPLADEFSPAEPVSVLIMKGTEDPLVPYEGGAIAPGVLGRLLDRAPRGKVVSTGREVELWLRANGLDVEPVAEKLPDTNKNDGAYLEKKEWCDPKRGVSVVLYDVVGGGHTYPGGLQYLPKALIGTTCRDADASAILWEFFESHPKSQESTGKE